MRILALAIIACATAAIGLAAIAPTVVFAWLLTALIVLLPELATVAGWFPSPPSRWQAIACAAHGLVAGAAAPLFLSSLPTASGVALTILACTCVLLAPVPQGNGKLGFGIHAIGCLGPFALAWWLSQGEGQWLAGVSIAAFGITASILASLLQDLTGRTRKLRLERDRLRERLRRCALVEREVDRLVGAACHDMRQPVAAIALISALLHQKATEPALEPALAALESGIVAINRQLIRITSIAQELQAASRHVHRPDPDPGH